MTQLHRIVGGLAAAVFALAGCGAEPTPSNDLQTPQIPIGPAAAQAGSPAPVGTPQTTPPITGLAGRAATTPVTTAGVAAPPPAKVTAGAPAPSGTAGTAAPTTPTTPTTPITSNGTGDNWDPKASLDANGVLKPPAAGQGFQMATPVFDLQPGQELYKCYHVAVPSDVEFPVGEWDSQMAPGSHHFILYRTAGDTVPDGTLTNNACTQGFGGETWLYTAGSPRGHLQFPDGVAMTLKPKERITFDLHYINTGSTVMKAKVILNANRVKAEKFVKADAQVSFNIGIAVPPRGTQTVKGECTPVPGAKYFLMQTHSHRFTTMAQVQRKLANGMLGETLSMSDNWELPEVRVWMNEPFLTFQPGEKFAYSCTYKNDTAATITVGISAEKNEMCMAEAYFFPQAASRPVCN